MLPASPDRTKHISVPTVLFIFQVGLAVVNGQLYAVGGFDGTTYLKTVEVYDRECNQWRQSGCMTYRRLGGGVGVVRLANDQATPCSGFVPDIPPFSDPPGIRD